MEVKKQNKTKQRNQGMFNQSYQNSSYIARNSKLQSTAPLLVLCDLQAYNVFYFFLNCGKKLRRGHKTVLRSYVSVVTFTLQQR